MNLKTVVIGSGLSSLSFVDKFLEKNDSIDLISPDFEFLNKEEFFPNKHIYNDLPHQIYSYMDKINHYFHFNKISVDKNAKVLGSLEFGGLSNYWGCQMDQNFIDDLIGYNKKSKNEIINSFFEILKKFKLLGSFSHKKRKYENDYKVDSFFEKLLKKKFKDLVTIKPMLAYSNNTKLIPKNYYEKFLKKRKIKIHNYFVERIIYENNGVILKCRNQSELKTFYAKKVILGCGTLATTKLLMEFLKIKEEVRIKHHPRLVSVFFSKFKIKNIFTSASSQLHLRSKKKSNSFVVDFRSGNKTIIESATKLKKYLIPFKIILSLLKNFIIFSNILLDSNHSNLFMKMQTNDKIKIYSKPKNTTDVLKKIHKKIFNILRNEKMILPLSKNFFPGYGNDFHYFGTLTNNKKKKLSINQNCQLKGYKNIYVIDGSVFDFKVNKYPLGVIMANARRIAKKINK